MGDLVKQSQLCSKCIPKTWPIKKEKTMEKIKGTCNPLRFDPHFYKRGVAIRITVCEGGRCASHNGIVIELPEGGKFLRVIIVPNDMNTSTYDHDCELISIEEVEEGSVMIERLG